MNFALTQREIRELKARAQTMKAILKVGKEGLSEPFVAAVDEALQQHQLVKVKFDFHKDEKKALAPALAERTHSRLVTRLGNVAVLYRPKDPAPE